MATVPICKSNVKGVWVEGGMYIYIYLLFQNIQICIHIYIYICIHLNVLKQYKLELNESTKEKHLVEFAGYIILAGN